ncbi:Lrp/AsnC family transcriptional regulator [archaeon]|jgi:Lrp/AsnC family transcriptional regulator, leucine-responsive regulatory protein|nr:Lrp/AsnC family transcriptional regulator [archaeon]MBT3450364.1 Lrp/AsnC family transcriptional regulator [archaeon]MBT6868861.1 Lrp/AsnC family transcriptional regulator [archaeon]MBT7192918.1 Lrp/AsnC family transcriptional regulator [archaeon]MBT7380884.1 Lrp/AsnC family transcriptional regulator [archaeon]
MGSENKIKLDQKDKQILEFISQKARKSVAEISRKTGIQRDSVIYRIKRMESSGVIRFFHTVIDPVVLGYPVYTFVNITLHNFNNQDEKSFRGYLKEHSNVVYVAKTTGKWDYTIAIAARDLADFDEVMWNIRKKYSKIIKEYDSASIIKEHKYDYMVDLVCKK